MTESTAEQHDEQTPPQQPPPSSSPPPASPPKEQPDGHLTDDRDAADWDEARRLFNNKVEIHFHAEVDASEAILGVSNAGPDRISTRRATGVLNQRDVDSVLRWFVPPASFERASRTLAECNLVILVGDDGCGRRAGALALLRRSAGAQAKLTSVSPALTFAELASKFAFHGGCGYLIRDHIGDGEAAAVREFEATRLADKLRKAGGYLVVTATPAVISGRGLRQFAVEWQAPDPLTLFDECARGAEIEFEALQAARARAGQLLTPHEVVNLVRRLTEDPDNAVRALDDSTADQVVGWFDAEPRKPDVLAVAALAFLHGLPERVFEAQLAALHELSDEVEAATDELPQRRIDFARSHSLMTVERASVDGAIGRVSERVVVFCSPQHRCHVIAELYDRYGYQLWAPLRAWLDGMAAGASAEIRVELAHGLALLARTAVGEVAEIIDRWADGAAAERLTAAITLWWMCADDALASQSLQIAMRWVRNRGSRRAMTAAIALGGDLGLRYPSDALAWLWFLALRAERIGMIARQSIGFLFAAAADDPDSARSVLNMARTELRDVLSGSLSGRADTRTVRAARHTVVSMLRATSAATDEPAVVSVIREQGANLALLGALWADVLCSAPHRRGAFDALVQSLAAMANDRRPQTRDRVRELGAAVLSEMPEWNRHILRRDLMYATQNADRSSRPPRELVSALLAALDGPG
jgi:hypothetical protein